MQELLGARRRYDAMRRQLDLSSETDRGLHLCLTEAIRAIDGKIARLQGSASNTRNPERGKAARATG